MSNQISNKYLIIAQKATRLLKFIPFVRLIALSGSVARGNAGKESDIDFFIVVKSGRIWQTRLYVVLVLKMLGLHRNGDKPHQKIAKICLNRWVTDKYLLIDPQNTYHANQYSQIVPLYNEGDTYNKYIAKNNWITKYQPFKIIKIKSSDMSIIKKIKEWSLQGWIGNKIENITRYLQLKSILKDSRVNKPGSGLYVDDNQLRFHPNPK